ncbi:MAG: hypothetical protein HC836_45485 [Richelia sp. RM2_1_2]|nr:hypothetical protein [Richelia sp. RM2_1_2]
METCYPRARRFWTPELPQLGHCAVASLIVHDLFGGKILRNDENYHFWNELPDGKQVDLTIKQFDEIPEGTLMIADAEVDRQELLDNPDTAMRYEILKSRI